MSSNRSFGFRFLFKFYKKALWIIKNKRDGEEEQNRTYLVLNRDFFLS